MSHFNVSSSPPCSWPVRYHPHPTPPHPGSYNWAQILDFVGTSETNTCRYKCVKSVGASELPWMRMRLNFRRPLRPQQLWFSQFCSVHASRHRAMYTCHWGVSKLITGNCACQLSPLRLAQVGHFNGVKYFIKGMFDEHTYRWNQHKNMESKL